MTAALHVLGQNTALYSALLPAGDNGQGVDQVAVPAGVRTAWAQVHRVIRGEQKVFPAVFAPSHASATQADLKKSKEALADLAKCPNYDPLCLSAVHEFQQKLLVTRPVIDEGLVNGLVRLRELFLEMSPMQSHRYRADGPEFQFRLGDTPLNLHTLGDRPIKGEIAADVKAFVEDRLELYEAKQNELKAAGTEPARDRSFAGARGEGAGSAARSVSNSPCAARFASSPVLVQAQALRGYFAAAAGAGACRL
jgi:hypothetical protein